MSRPPPSLPHRSKPGPEERRAARKRSTACARPGAAPLRRPACPARGTAWRPARPPNRAGDETHTGQRHPAAEAQTPPPRAAPRVPPSSSAGCHPPDRPSVGQLGARCPRPRPQRDAPSRPLPNQVSLHSAPVPPTRPRRTSASTPCRSPRAGVALGTAQRWAY